jgi:transcriptional regulator GlxA family with amidase domain
MDLTGPFEVFAAFRILLTASSPKRLARCEMCTGSARARCSSRRRAAARRAAHTWRFRSGSADGGRGGARLDKATGKGAQCVFAVCTGVLICGAAGLIKGRQATTHWSAQHLPPFFGAVPVNKRVVVNGNMVFAAGVTSGIDGALYVAARLRGEDAANSIQLDMEYAPEPPFNTGMPETAPADILDPTRHLFEASMARREETARRIANRLGVSIPTRT